MRRSTILIEKKDQDDLQAEDEPSFLNSIRRRLFIPFLHKTAWFAKACSVAALCGIVASPVGAVMDQSCTRVFLTSGHRISIPSSGTWISGRLHIADSVELVLSRVVPEIFSEGPGSTGLVEALEQSLEVVLAAVADKLPEQINLPALLQDENLDAGLFKIEKADEDFVGQFRIGSPKDPEFVMARLDDQNGQLEVTEYLFTQSDKFFDQDDNEIKITALIDWVPFGGGVLGFGQYWKIAGDEVDKLAGFFSLNGKHEFRLYLDIPKESDEDKREQLVYFRDIDYIARTSTHEAVVLLMGGGTSSLVRITEGNYEAEQLARLPRSIRSRPLYPEGKEFRGPRRAHKFYQTIEQRPLVSSIATIDGVPHVLFKSSMTTDSRTRWDLLRLNEDGSVGQGVMLPTDAPHIMLIPGPDHLAIIERAPVEILQGTVFPFRSSESILYVQKDELLGRFEDDWSEATSSLECSEVDIVTSIPS